MKRNASDPAVKREALQLADELGSAEASRRTGVPASTIRMWRSRARTRGSATDIKPKVAETGRERQIDPARGARGTWRVAERATRAALEAIDSGDTLAAQRLMVTAGIAADKTGQLEEAAGRAEERQARISLVQAETIATVLHLALEGIGLPAGAATKRVIGSLLRQATSGEPMVAHPAATETARAELLTRLRQQVREDMEVERSMVEPAALPAPGPEPVLDPEPPSEPASEPVESVEITEAEVVEDDPGHGELEPPPGFMRGTSERVRLVEWARVRQLDRKRQEREQNEQAIPSMVVHGPSRAGRFAVPGHLLAGPGGRS